MAIIVQDLSVPQKTGLSAHTFRPGIDPGDFRPDQMISILWVLSVRPCQDKYYTTEPCFGQDPFVDFGTSDPEAKAILLKTAFQLHARLTAKTIPGVEILVSSLHSLSWIGTQMAF